VTGKSRYEQLGVRRVVNASTTLTALGGSLMPSAVQEAMAEAGRSFVDLVELQERVGARLAEITRNEAGYVTSGAAAGITHAVAACIAGTDPERIAAFPCLPGVERREVLIPRLQRNRYDYAAQQTGARIVEMDDTEDALKVAMTERTACVLCFAGLEHGADISSVSHMAQLAHARGIPVLVDAAAQVPPISTLWQFTRDAGADAVIVSGGKGLRGPQSSGLVLGTTAIIEGCRANGNPNSAIGRPMKVGKEEMVGLLAAVEGYLEQDEDRMIAAYEATVAGWVEGLAGIPGVTAFRGVHPTDNKQPFSRAIVQIDRTFPVTRDEIVEKLWSGNPRIAVRTHGEDLLTLNAHTLSSGEEELVLERLLAILERAKVS